MNQQGMQPSGEGAPFTGTNALMTPHIRENLQSNGVDAQVDAWESQLAITGWDPNCLTTITGVTGAA